MSVEGLASLAGLPQRGGLPAHVVDGLPMPVVVSRTSDDIIVRVNPEYTAAYGYDSREVVGLPTRDIHFVVDDRRRTIDAQARGGLDSVEVRLRARSGESKWAQADISRFLLDGREDVLLTTFYDIEGLKRAEQRVREGEALLSEMALFPEKNPGPVMRLDMSGTVRRSNAAARALFGETLEGRCFWDICPDFSADARARALVGGAPMQEDVQIQDRWLRLTVTHAEGTDQIFIYGTDITSQRAAERELEERARFPAMNPGPVARLSSDGFVIRANPAASRLFGRESLQGLSWLEICPGIDEKHWSRVRQADGLVQHEAEIGDRCYSFTLRHEPLADQVFVYGTDVTELKSAEQALAELARFPEMNPGPVCRLNRDGIVLLANRAADGLFGSAGLTGRSWLELVPSAGGAFWSRLLTTGETAAIEAKVAGRDYVLTHAPGPEGVFVFVYGSDITREKDAERALRQSEKMATLGTLAAGVAHELNNPAAATQRAAEQLQRLLGELQTTRAELDSRMRGHDQVALVTELDARAREAASCPCDLDPLARSDLEASLEEWLEGHGTASPWDVAPSLVEAGYGVADLQELSAQTGADLVGLVASWYALTHRAYRLLEEIRQGSARLAEIVGAMKSYSYLGQAPVQNVDVNEGLRSTLVILRSKLKAGIAVHQELDPSLPRIEAYGGELNQVWTNLLDNAADAMEGRGEIRLRTRRADSGVVVEIEDNGPGIPEDIRPRVFDAFFTTKPPGAGTGLGLNTSYKIVVERHGGSIRVDSEPGRTCFTVELPVQLPTSAKESGTSEHLMEGRT